MQISIALLKFLQVDECVKSRKEPGVALGSFHHLYSFLSSGLALASFALAARAAAATAAVTAAIAAVVALGETLGSVGLVDMMLSFSSLRGLYYTTKNLYVN
jgi:hypothetical protein